MRNSAPRSQFRPRLLWAMLGVLATLGLGACSRSMHVSESLVAPSPDDPGALSKTGVEASRATKTPPAVPTLISPADGASNLATEVTLSWNASAGATASRNSPRGAVREQGGGPRRGR
jgi:hypothetical protein